MPTSELDRPLKFEGKATTVLGALDTMWKRAEGTEAFDANRAWLRARFDALPLDRKLMLWAELCMGNHFGSGRLDVIGIEKEELANSPVAAAWAKAMLPRLEVKQDHYLKSIVCYAAAKNKVSIPAALAPVVEWVYAMELLSRGELRAIRAVCEVKTNIPPPDDLDDGEYEGVEPVPLTVTVCDVLPSPTPIQKKQLARARKDYGGNIEDVTYRAIADAKGKHVYDAYRYCGDTGKVFVAGTTRVVASLIQMQIDGCRDPGLGLALQQAFAVRPTKAKVTVKVKVKKKRVRARR